MSDVHRLFARADFSQMSVAPPVRLRTIAADLTHACNKKTGQDTEV